MKHTFLVAMATACLLLTANAQGQETKTDSTKKKHSVSIGMSDEGIQISSAGDDKKEKKEKKHQTEFMIVDVGTNFIQDKTNYNDPAVKSFMNVPANRQNASLFNLQQSKSVNVNIDFFMEKFRLLSTKNQKISISTGLGLQLYNFRYESPITFTRNPDAVVLDTVSFKKNKLAFDYLNVPLMLEFKTRLTKKEWLIYGAGITGGYSLSTWTKQESSERGKVKVHDTFDFSPFNSCITAEIGISSLRFYASYQLNSMYTNGINQHPICIGIRFD